MYCSKTISSDILKVYSIDYITWYLKKIYDMPIKIIVFK